MIIIHTHTFIHKLPPINPTQSGSNKVLVQALRSVFGGSVACGQVTAHVEVYMCVFKHIYIHIYMHIYIYIHIYMCTAGVLESHQGA
jgi:hypothetical protein